MNNSKAPRTKSIASTILVIVMAAAYIGLKPKVEEWLGTPLPPIDGGGEQAPPDKSELPADGTASTAESAPKAAPQQDDNASDQSVKGGSREALAGTRPILVAEGKNFRSAAGLIYSPGSRDGHRRKHVLRHAVDDLSKPVHGVFDQKDAIFALVDEAYQKVKSRSDDVSRRQEGRRTSYVIKMRRRIGFKGGRNGKRDGNPPLSQLKLVLEGNEVITAFPY